MASKKNTEAPLLERALRGVDLTLDTLERCLQITRDKLFAQGNEYDSTLASHAAWVGKHLCIIAENARKLEATQAKQVKQLTPKQQDALIRGYISDLPRERLAELIKFINELNPAGSVL